MSYRVCSPTRRRADLRYSSLIYPRNLPQGARTDVPAPDRYGIKDWEAVKLVTKDGETLNSYFLKSSSSRPVGATVCPSCVRPLARSRR